MSIIKDIYDHEHELPGPYSTIDEIKSANKARGNYWFSPDTVQFFDSKIEPKVYEGRIFISSEQFHGLRGDDGPRQWKVRVCGDEGGVNTLIDNPFASLDDAEQAVADLVMEAEKA